jgi:hypothetical protein
MDHQNGLVVPDGITFDHPLEDSSAPEQPDPFFASLEYASTQLLGPLSTVRDCIEQESNYIALMEFDHDVEEAIEQLNALRSFAVERVSHIRNLSLLEAA